MFFSKINTFPKKKTMLWFLLFGYFCCVTGCTSWYSTYFWAEHPQASSDFSWASQDFSGGTILSFPHKEKEEMIVEQIDAAQKKIWIEIYLWTRLDQLYSAIENAHARGVDIKVLLEGNVYGLPQGNQNTIQWLQEQGIPLFFSDSNRYTFTHAKFWIIDDAYCISTGNWTRSSFSSNREYIFCAHNDSTRKILESMFLADTEQQAWKDRSKIPQELVISPLNARESILHFIAGTHQDLLIYTQSVTDSEVLNALNTLYNEGKTVHVCTADNSQNRDAADTFDGMEWYFSKKPYPHTKLMVRDETTVFLGSQNFTTNALDNNREVGIIFTGSLEQIQGLQDDFFEGCVP